MLLPSINVIDVTHWYVLTVDNNVRIVIVLELIVINVSKIFVVQFYECKQFVVSQDIKYLNIFFIFLFLYSFNNATNKYIY